MSFAVFADYGSGLMVLVMGNSAATIAYCFIRVVIGGALQYLISKALSHNFRVFELKYFLYTTIWCRVYHITNRNTTPIWRYPLLLIQ